MIIIFKIVYVGYNNNTKQGYKYTLFNVRVVLAHHVPDAQDNGACSYMTAQAAAGRVSSVPRRNHLSVQKQHG